MTPRTSAAAAAFILAAASGAAHAQGLLTPGYWENEVVLAAHGNTPFVTRTCMAPEEAKSVEEILGEMQSSCNLTRRTIAGGKIDVAGTCTESDGSKSTLKMTGSFTPTSYQLVLQHGTADPSVSRSMKLKSRRVASTCPDEED